MLFTMITREITPHLIRLFAQYPFVTVTGPRQSGKTTLCRVAFPALRYVNLEAPNQREFAASDPLGFLGQLGDGAILDEIQRVPELLSYLQVLADERGRNGLFVLTGSEQFGLSGAIGQSLAGRTALLRLLPFSLAERRQTGAGESIDEILYSGFYPRIHDRKLEPRQALGDYLETYVERDVRRLGEIRNLSGFQRFVRLCAGRVGQLVNLSALGADAGVSHVTARQWLSVLEASYVAFLLTPFHANIRKRLVKSPKLYFYDVGLASHLIGIEHAGQVSTHPLRGPLFENAVIVEALKHPLQPGPPGQPVVLPRRPRLGVRPALRGRQPHGGHRDQIRRHDCRRRLRRPETSFQAAAANCRPSCCPRWYGPPVQTGRRGDTLYGSAAGTRPLRTNGRRVSSHPRQQVSTSTKMRNTP